MGNTMMEQCSSICGEKNTVPTVYSSNRTSRPTDPSNGAGTTVEDKEQAAVKIQAVARGKQDRKAVERMKEMDEVVVQNDDDDSNVVHNVNPKSLISDNVYKVG
jgi:hypothetical protein